MQRAIMLALSTACITAVTAHAVQIEATISTQHCYGLYVGDAAGSEMMLVGADCTQTAVQRTDHHTLSLEGRQQVFLVVWGGQQAADGLLAEFEAQGLSLMSGDGTWRVYRTGQNRYAGEGAPQPWEMRRLLREANVSNGWQPIEAGQRNDASVQGPVADIHAEARWMWARHDGDMIDRAGSSGGECLIFRTYVVDLWPENELFGEFGLGGTPSGMGIRPASIGNLPTILGAGGGGFDTSGAGGVSRGGGSYPYIAPPELFDMPDTPAPDFPNTSIPSGGPVTTTTRKDIPDVPDSGQDTPPAPDPEKPYDPPPGPQPVPEPSSGLLVLLGAMALRRRSH